MDVVRRVASPRWAWLELLRDADPHFVQRTFGARQALHEVDLVRAFGSTTPHSGDVVLHAMPEPQGMHPRRTPVVLVHGATKTGHYWTTESPLARDLHAQGFRVFAVTFAHAHDDNHLQAQALANAIERVKVVTGARQVDLVAHSKGGVVARVYCSDFRQPWMTPYRGDVRRLVLVATPNGGLDYSFRHPLTNLALLGDGAEPVHNAPISWDAALTPLGVVDTRDVGFRDDGPNFFPGQSHLLRRLDGAHPLPMLEPDGYTTYHGGRGFVSASAGIEHFIEQGGRFMDRLAAVPVDPTVDVFVLAGSSPDVAGILNEYSGPSDGLVFVSSAVDLPAGSHVKGEDVLPLNHKTLVSDSAGIDWIRQALAASGTG